MQRLFQLAVQIFIELKISFKKSKPKEILYPYKKLDKNIFKQQLRCKLINCNKCALLEKHILDVLNEHTPLKKNVICSNEASADIL